MAVPNGFCNRHSFGCGTVIGRPVEVKMGFYRTALEFALGPLVRRNCADSQICSTTAAKTKTPSTIDGIFIAIRGTPHANHAAMVTTNHMQNDSTFCMCVCVCKTLSAHQRFLDSFVSTTFPLGLFRVPHAFRSRASQSVALPPKTPNLAQSTIIKLSGNNFEI